MTLRRKTELKRGGQLSRTSKKRLRDLRGRPAIRKAVFERDQHCLLSPFGGAWGYLNLYGSSWGPCFGEPLTAHHLRKEGQGGEYTLDNLVTLCAGHNDLVEDYPAAARNIGLVR